MVYVNVVISGPLIEGGKVVLVMLDKELVMARIDKMWGVDKNHPFYHTLSNVVDACIHLNKRGIQVNKEALTSFIYDKESELRALDTVCYMHTNKALTKIPNPAELAKYLGVRGVNGVRQELKLRDEFLSELYTKSREINRDMHKGKNLLTNTYGNMIYPDYTPNAHALGYIRSNKPNIVDRVKPKFFIPSKGNRHIGVHVQYNAFYHVGNMTGNALLQGYYDTHLSPIRDFARVLFGREYSSLYRDEKLHYINWHTGSRLVKPKTGNFSHLKEFLPSSQLSIVESVSDYHAYVDTAESVFNTIFGREIRKEAKNKSDLLDATGGFSKMFANNADFTQCLVSTIYSKYKDEFAFILGDECYLEIDKHFSYEKLVSDLTDLSKDISNKTGWSRVRFVIQDKDTEEKLYAQ
jgi:hypothetical protein